MRLRSRLVPLVVASVLATACSLVGEDTAGERGVFSFDYSASQCGLLAGCALDKPVLAGAEVTVHARGGDGSGKRLEARILQSELATISSQSERCVCAKGGVDIEVAPADPCPPGERKRCSLTIEVDSSGAAGDATLEILEQGGEAIDRATIQLRPADQIHLAVRANGELVTRGADDRFEVKLGDTVALEAKVFDAAARTMVFTRRGLTHEYADPDIMRQKADDPFGWSDIENLELLDAGETQIVVRATGAEATIRFRVTP